MRILSFTAKLDENMFTKEEKDIKGRQITNKIQ